MFSTIGYFICIPFSALLRLFYTLTSSYGVSLILFTLVIKLILLPLQMKSKKSMIRMGRMSGQISEIQKKYANNRAKMNEEMQKFYAEEGVNPAGGCVWSFLPMPILLALYYIIREPIEYFMSFGGRAEGSAVVETIRGIIEGAGMTVSGNAAYEQIEMINIINKNPELFTTVTGMDGWVNLNYSFLGIDLSSVPSSMITTLGQGVTWAALGVVLIPLISGLLSFFLSKVTMSSQSGGAQAAQQQATMKTMTYMMPLMSVYIGFILPAALGVYWIAQSGISIIQEFFVGRYFTKKFQEEEDLRDIQRAADRQKRMEEGRVKQEAQNKESQRKAVAKKKAAVSNANQPKVTTTEEGRVGNRPYARGRAYNENRYNK